MCAVVVTSHAGTQSSEQAGIAGSLRALPPALPSCLRCLPDRRNLVSRERLRDRICSEYREMPGMQLTAAQAARLFALDCATCERVLHECVCEGWLRRTAAGRYGLACAAP
jgi:hypothetical protein